MTRYQTIACIVIAAINIASLVVVVLAVYGSRDARINTVPPNLPRTGF